MAIALTVTQATAADVPALVLQYNAVRTELLGDFGDVPVFNAAYFTDLLSWDRPIAIARSALNVVRGACVFLPMGEEGVAMEIVATDKSLSLINRLWVHRQLVLWMANQVPGNTPIFGWVKVNGNLATYLATHSTAVEVHDGFAKFSVTAADCIAASLVRP